MIPSGVCAMEMADRLLSKLKSYNKNEDGAFSIMWGVSLIVMVGAVGMGVDYAVATSSFAKAQTLADTTALAAAINVRDNGGEIPTNQSEGLFGDYTAAQLGYKFSNSVINGAAGVSVNVSYDAVKREAHVTLNGATRPFFLQAFGYNDFKFDGASVVKFEEKQPLEPASVALILDNSGSMFFDDNPVDSDGNRPPNTQRRIDGLISSANSFMDLLDEQVGPQDGSSNEPRVLRTGMMAFATGIIPARTVSMNWGTISRSSISSMVPGGATNSAPPLAVADTWLNINEPPIQKAENPGQNALKFLVLMTDGRNTVGDEEWVAREGTENWRRFVTGRDSDEGLTGERPSDPPIPTTTEISPGGFNALCYRNRTLRYTLGPYSQNPGNFWNRSQNGQWHICYSNEFPAVTETKWSGYEYFVGETPPGGSWEEGEPDITSNIQTREECDSLHEQGVEVFSIAYALAEGDYITNDWGQQNFNNPNRTVETTTENSNDARAILQYCASRSENFITADNTEALDLAFTRIGNTIIKEIIRIDS